MSPPLNRKWLAAGALLLLAVAAGIWSLNRDRLAGPATWEKRDQAIAALDQDLQRLAGRIQSLARSGCEFNTDCKVVGLGGEYCGGYHDFLIYSAAESDEGELRATVREFNRLASQKANLLIQVPSCGTQPREAACIEKKCVVVER